MSAVPPSELVDWSRVRVHGIAAGALFVADSLVATLGMTAMFALVTLVIGLPVIAFHASHRRWARVQTRAFIIAVYLAALLGVALSTGVQNAIARSRAQTLTQAANAYRTRFGEFPDRLSQLAPDFVEHVPKAKVLLYGGEFSYSKGDDGKHRLSWKEVGPYRAQVELETGAWSRVEQ